MKMKKLLCMAWLLTLVTALFVSAPAANAETLEITSSLTATMRSNTATAFNAANMVTSSTDGRYGLVLFDFADYVSRLDEINLVNLCITRNTDASSGASGQFKIYMLTPELTHNLDEEILTTDYSKATELGFTDYTSGTVWTSPTETYAEKEYKTSDLSGIIKEYFSENPGETKIGFKLGDSAGGCVLMAGGAAQDRKPRLTINNDIIPFPVYPNAAIASIQSGDRATAGTTNYMLDGRANRKTMLTFRIDCAEYKDKLETVDKVTFKFNGSREGAGWDGKYILEFLQPPTSFDNTGLKWSEAEKLVVSSSYESEFFYVGAPQHQYRNCEIETGDISSNLLLYFSDYPDTTDVYVRINPATAKSIFRVYSNFNSGYDLAQTACFNIDMDDSQRTADMLGEEITVPGPGDVVRITANNTYGNDTIDVTYESNGISQTESVVAGNGSTNKVLKLPEIKAVDNKMNITATIKNKNGIVKSSASGEFAFKPYRVRFDSLGGTKITPIRGFAAGDTVSAALVADKIPEKQDCEFDGWYKEPECINKWVFASEEETAEPSLIEENTTLYAKWISNRDNTYVRTIEKPSYDFFWRHQTSEPQTDEAMFYKESKLQGLEFFAPGGLPLQIDGRSETYREAVIRYDLEKEDIDAILAADGTTSDGKAKLTLNVFTAQNATNMNVWIAPADGVYDVNLDYPKRAYPDGRIDVTNINSLYASAYDMFKAGVSGRDFADRNILAASEPVTEVGEYTFDLTYGLQKYFTKYPNAKAFALMITPDGKGIYEVTGSTNSLTGPKLAIPAKSETAASGVVNESGEEITMENINAAKRIVVKDMNSTIGIGVPIIGYYAENGTLIDVRMPAEDEYTITPYLAVIKQAEENAAADAVSAKIIWVESIAGMKPLKASNSIE